MKKMCYLDFLYIIWKILLNPRIFSEIVRTLVRLNFSMLSSSINENLFYGMSCLVLCYIYDIHLYILLYIKVESSTEIHFIYTIFFLGEANDIRERLNDVHGLYLNFVIFLF